MSHADSAPGWADVALASALFAIDPRGLGGIVLRSAPGPARDAVCAAIRADLPAPAPLLRVPLHISEDRLLGGLSLAATLRTGALVFERGVLAQADGGAVLVAMAERLDRGVCTHLCTALDRGAVSLERDGVTAVVDTRLGVVALDEGLDDERPPTALVDRLAFHLDLGRLGSPPTAEPHQRPTTVQARARLAAIALDATVLEALCGAAATLGIASLRATVFAAAAARAHAALAGRAAVTESDVAVAARLVLAPRATRFPADPAEQEPAEPPPSDTPAPEGDEQPQPTQSLEDVVVAAARSAIPEGLLDALVLGREPRPASGASGRAGTLRASTGGGRPVGTRQGLPRPGDRLDIVETLRAAAPWQLLRRRERTASSGESSGERRARIEVRKDDFRTKRFEERTESSVVFAVDASGSAALQRLAEAKGAVEQVLADCYVRRDHVALVAFRNTKAALLLPPTRSLARARRCLADLVGGGTTPLAAGIEAALTLALESRKRGRTPVIVLMTDGRANIARDGGQGGPVATEDSLACAKLVRAAGVKALFLDTAPRPRPQGRALATAMGARYLPLPYVDAAGISRHVQSLTGEMS